MAERRLRGPAREDRRPVLHDERLVILGPLRVRRRKLLRVEDEIRAIDFDARDEPPNGAALVFRAGEETAPKCGDRLVSPGRADAAGAQGIATNPQGASRECGVADAPA